MRSRPRQAVLKVDDSAGRRSPAPAPGTGTGHVHRLRVLNNLEIFQAYLNRHSGAQAAARVWPDTARIQGDTFCNGRHLSQLPPRRQPQCHRPLADRLEALFGPERVFRDVDSIAPGLDFEAALTRAVGGASVMLAVIGPRWADIRDAQGHLRLDDPQDTVRREIEAALATGLPVIPVLVEGASMPTAATMPASLAPFARCQAFDLDDAGWQDDVARLAVQLQQRHGVDPSAPAGPAQRAGSGALELVELLAQPRRVILRRAGPGGRDALQRATRCFWPACCWATC